MVDLATTTKRHLRVEEVCELFDVSRRTVYYWIENGKLPSIKIGGSQRIPVDVLTKLLPTYAASPVLASLLVQSRNSNR